MFLLRRILPRRVCPCRVSLKNYSHAYVDLPSALYVGLEHKSTVFSALDPHFDVDSTFKDIPKLKLDLEKRELKVDVDALYQYSLKYQRLNSVIKNASKKMDSLRIELKRLNTKAKASDPSAQIDKDALKERLSEVNSELQAARHEFLPLEKDFLIPFLQLPNPLHKNTTQHDEVLFSQFPKPAFSFDPVSHVEIGERRGELDFRNVSPTSFYMKGNLAVVELAVGDFILSRFQKHGFTNYSNMDIARAVLVEGCAIDLKRESNALEISSPNCLAFNQMEYIMGGSSLPSFVAPFCKGLLTFSNDSPIRLVSIGRKYKTPAKAENQDTQGLFNCIQSTCVSAFLAYPHDAIEEAVFNEMAMMITQLYTELGLHFKLIQYGASKLETYESLAVGVCLFAPSLNKYVEVGRISLCQDFISKRLQILESLGKRRAVFLGMIHVQIMDLRNWIGCMLENNQTSGGDYGVPKCLHPFMYR